MKRLVLYTVAALLLSLAIVPVQAQSQEDIDISTYDQLYEVYPLFEADNLPITLTVSSDDSKCIRTPSDMYCAYMQNAVAIKNILRVALSDGSVQYTFTIDRRMTDEIDMSFTDIVDSISEAIPNITRSMDLECIINIGSTDMISCSS